MAKFSNQSLFAQLVQILLGLALLLPFQFAVALEEQPHLVLRFCQPGVTLATVDPIRDCRLPKRPDMQKDYGTTQQLILATVESSAAQAQTTFWVTPYYLRHIGIYKRQGAQWIPIAQGGAELGAELVSAGLGGHRFSVPLVSGTDEFLIQITAPNFAHLAIRLDSHGTASNKQEVMLAFHLGVLSLLFVLVVSAWVIRPAALEARLMVLTFFVLVSVVIGSGAIYRIWPDASVHWVGFFLFNAAVAGRVGAIAWVYASLIGPYNNRKSYHRLNALTYVVTATAVVLFALNLPSLGWPLVGMLLLLALFAPSWGLFTAKPMPRLLSGAVLGSVLFYLGLNLFAFYSLSHTSGQNDWPVYMIRAVDLALPLVLFALVILRNRVADRELEQARAEVAAKATQLSLQQRITEEKRLLLDMLAHEIKNPLASIRFAVRTLDNARPEETALRERRLQSIGQSVQSIDEIIERCNLANGLEENTINAQVESVAVDELLRSLAQASEQRERFALSLQPVPTIESDPYLIKIVMANLLDNAVKYAKPGSTIDVAVRPGPGGVVLRVANALVPGTVLDVDRLFDRYYRHDSAQHVRGSGLGLALSQSVCELLGARINCHVRDDHIEFEVSFESC